MIQWGGYGRRRTVAARQETERERESVVAQASGCVCACRYTQADMYM